MKTGMTMTKQRYAIFVVLLTFIFSGPLYGSELERLLKYFEEKAESKKSNTQCTKRNKKRKNKSRQIQNVWEVYSSSSSVIKKRKVQAPFIKSLKSNEKISYANINIKTKNLESEASTECNDPTMTGWKHYWIRIKNFKISDLESLFMMHFCDFIDEKQGYTTLTFWTDLNDFNTYIINLSPLIKRLLENACKKTVDNKIKDIVISSILRVHGGFIEAVKQSGGTKAQLGDLWDLEKDQVKVPDPFFGKY